MLLSVKFEINKIQSEIKQNKYLKGVFVLALLGSAICSQMNGRVDLYFGIFNNVLLYYASAFLGPYLFTILPYR